MTQLFGDTDILAAIEQIDLKHRHEHISVSETLDDWVNNNNNMDEEIMLINPEIMLLESCSDTSSDELSHFMLNTLSSSTHGTNFYTPSEDIWQKFDLGHIDQDDDDLFNCNVNDDDLLLQLNSNEEEEISEIKHDCMWSGQCLNETHGDLTPPISPIKQQQPSKPINSRSLLNPQRFQTQKVVRNNKYVQSKMVDTKLAINKIVRERMNGKLLDSEGEEHRPDTPVSDFDDQLFHHGIDTESSSDDYDSDTTTAQIRKRNGFYNDHSYHIVRSSSVASNHHTTTSTKSSTDAVNNTLPDSLGVQTPSDSEEEIDVVSLGSCHGSPSPPPMIDSISPSPSSSSCRTLPISKQPTTTIKSEPVPILRSSRHPPTNLPTNPSPSDKHNLQLSMAAAAVKQRAPIAPIRIRLDKRKTTTTTASPSYDTDSSSTESATSTGTVTPKRGVKRSRKRTTPADSTPKKRGNNTTTPVSATTSSRSNNSDSEDSGKRTMHNTMERQRRIDLRNAFEDLRLLIPKLEVAEKAPKVHILKEAGLYCRQLQINETLLGKKRHDMKRYQHELREQLSRLRRQVATRR